MTHQDLNEGIDGAVAQERLVRQSLYVVMKELHGLYSADRDVHCVCADRKTAKTECDYRNERSRTNSYFVKRVPFMPNAESIHHEGEKNL